MAILKSFFLSDNYYQLFAPEQGVVLVMAGGEGRNLIDAKALLDLVRGEVNTKRQHIEHPLLKAFSG